MDTQATSPTGRSATAPELPTPTAQGVPTGASGIAETPATETAAVQTPATAAHTPATAAQVAEVAASPPETDQRAPGFRERGRMRRRMRFLRKARELGYRDLGGLVFEMHRLGQRHDELVAAKLEMLDRFDGELRALEATLRERRPITVLREAGVAACPRCAAIHGSADSFCPACGTPMGPHADRPIAATPAPPPAAPPTAAPPTAALTPPPPTAPAPAPPASPPPPQTANPPVAAPKAAADDRPTEIIRPSDGSK